MNYLNKAANGEFLDFIPENLDHIPENSVYKRYISEEWVNIKTTFEKFTVLMYNFFSKSKRIFHSKFIKRCLPFDLVHWVVFKYMCGRCNSSYYGETNIHLKVRSGKHIGISPLTFAKVEPSKESAIRDHLLICNNIPSFAEFTILAYGHHKYILEIKERWLIKQDRPILNKNIISAKLFLFDNN